MPVLQLLPSQAGLPAESTYPGLSWSTALSVGMGETPAPAAFCCSGKGVATSRRGWVDRFLKLHLNQLKNSLSDPHVHSSGSGQIWYLKAPRHADPFQIQPSRKCPLLCQFSNLFFINLPLNTKIFKFFYLNLRSQILISGFKRSEGVWMCSEYHWLSLN